MPIHCSFLFFYHCISVTFHGLALLDAQLNKLQRRGNHWPVSRTVFKSPRQACLGPWPTCGKEKGICLFKPLRTFFCFISSPNSLFWISRSQYTSGCISLLLAAYDLVPIQRTHSSEVFQRPAAESHVWGTAKEPCRVPASSSPSVMKCPCTSDLAMLKNTPHLCDKGAGSCLQLPRAA